MNNTCKNCEHYIKEWNTCIISRCPKAKVAERADKRANGKLFGE